MSNSKRIKKALAARRGSTKLIKIITNHEFSESM